MKILKRKYNKATVKKMKHIALKGPLLMLLWTTLTTCPMKVKLQVLKMTKH